MGDGDVDVWRGLVVDVPPTLLAADELAELGRLRVATARTAFVARRSALREVLAGYVHVPPAELDFDRTCERCGDPDHGKPRLRGPGDVSFSATSRAGRWMIAVADGAMSVGVDLEHVDDAVGDLHASVLTPAEQVATDRADATAVTRLWCRKEALVKAQGVGLGRADTPPDALEVTAPDLGGWHLLDVESWPGWVAAVAAARPIRRVRVLDAGTPGHAGATK